MASAYLYHLVQNHSFIDGNKRVGLASAVTFLILNGIELDSSLDEADPQHGVTPLQKFVIQVASGAIKKPEIAEYFRSHSK